VTAVVDTNVVAATFDKNVLKKFPDIAKRPRLPFLELNSAV
jgi:hypothetical protein